MSITTTQLMEVPEHIYIGGNESGRKRTTSLNINVLEEMRVPDRIVINGGNTSRGRAAQPIEVLNDKFDPINYNVREN